eukprot:1235017-Prymnesium_polylepis.1
MGREPTWCRIPTTPRLIVLDRPSTELAPPGCRLLRGNGEPWPRPTLCGELSDESAPVWRCFAESLAHALVVKPRLRRHEGRRAPFWLLDGDAWVELVGCRVLVHKLERVPTERLVRAQLPRVVPAVVGTRCKAIARGAPAASRRVLRGVGDEGALVRVEPRGVHHAVTTFDTRKCWLPRENQQDTGGVNNSVLVGQEMRA